MTQIKHIQTASGVLLINTVTGKFERRINFFFEFGKKLITHQNGDELLVSEFVIILVSGRVETKNPPETS